MRERRLIEPRSLISLVNALAASASYHFIPPRSFPCDKPLLALSLPPFLFAGREMPACLPLASVLLARCRFVRESPQKPSHPLATAARRPFYPPCPNIAAVYRNFTLLNVRHGRFGLVLPATRPVADGSPRSTRSLDHPLPRFVPLRPASPRLALVIAIFVQGPYSILIACD